MTLFVLARDPAFSIFSHPQHVFLPLWLQLDLCPRKNRRKKRAYKALASTLATFKDLFGKPHPIALLHIAGQNSILRQFLVLRKAEKCSSCCCSVAQLCLTLCDLMDCSMPTFLFFTISRSLLKFMSCIELMSSNHLILCHSLLLLPSIFPSIRVFSNESALGIRWPKFGASALASVV